MTEVTLILPYYRNCLMLKRQVQEWNRYPAPVKIICVDDGSPEPALPIIEANATVELRERLRVYRITVDVAWNREGARNLGARHADTAWIVHVDIDHILPAESAIELLQFEPNPERWYRFPRWRRGRADETRKKDAIPDHVEYGRIHPHVDSYLVRRELYWQAGGYDEDFSGCLGGGNDFLARLSKISLVSELSPAIRLEVYTRSEIEDASDWSLSRDKTEGHKRRDEKKLTRGVFAPPANTLRFPWTQQI